jgi:hypothetical protein
MKRAEFIFKVEDARPSLELCLLLCGSALDVRDEGGAVLWNVDESPGYTASLFGTHCSQLPSI